MGSFGALTVVRGGPEGKEPALERVGGAGSALADLSGRAVGKGDFLWGIR